MRLAFLVLIFLLALLIRVAPLETDFGWDESAYLQLAAQLHGKDNYTEMYYRPPVLPLLLAGAMYAGKHPYWLGLFFSLVSASVVLPLFLLGKRFHSELAGLFTALVGAVHPLLTEQGHMLLTDGLVAVFLIWSFWLVARDSRWLVGIAAGIAGLTKFTGLAAMPLFAGWMVFKRRWKSLIAFIIGWSIVIGSYLLWSEKYLGGYRVAFDRSMEILSREAVPFAAYLTSDLFTPALLLGVIASLFLWRERKDLIIFSFAWLILFMGYFSTLPYKEPRYAIVALVPLFVLSGVGLADIIGRIRLPLAKGAAIAVIVLVSLTPALSVLEQPFINEWQSPASDAAQFLAKSGQPIYATSHYPVFGYKTNAQVVVVDGPSFERAYPRIMPKEGFLVVRKDALRPPTTKWADSRREMGRAYENEAFVVYRYDPSDI